jgi:hypothetical protein
VGLTVKAILEAAKKNNCRNIRLVLHKPRRCFNLFEEDINLIREMVMNTGLNLREKDEEYDCEIPLTLLPSKHLEAGKNTVNTGLLVYVEKELTSWVSSTILGKASYLQSPIQSLIE